MLRESVELAGESIDFQGLTDPSCGFIKGVPHSEALLRFADAWMGDDEAALATARAAVADALGPEALVDAAGVASNFQRMVRIADAIGIPADPALMAVSEDLRDQLGINDYVSAANTRPPSFLKKLMLKLVAGRKFRKMIRQASD